MLPHQQADFVHHIAIDIGGSLIKLVYFSPEDTLGESGDAADKGRNHAGGAQPWNAPLSSLPLVLPRQIVGGDYTVAKLTKAAEKGTSHATWIL